MEKKEKQSAKYIENAALRIVYVRACGCDVHKDNFMVANKRCRKCL